MIGARKTIATLALIAAMTAVGPAHATTSDHFVAKQQQDQWTASTLIGQPVISSSGDKVGDVNDLVFNPNGKLAAIVVGVGGFLGVGEKNVAIPVSRAITDGKKSSDVVVHVNFTKDALEKAPSYKPLDGVGIGTVGKLFQQAKDVGAKVTDAAQTAVDKGKELGRKAADEATKLKNRVVEGTEMKQ